MISKALKTRFCSFYWQNIYKHVRFLRGATRLADYCHREMCDSLPEVEESATPIRELDWDYLFILDAARHDIYEEVAGKGVGYRVSIGSCSKEFISGNFSEESFQDTVLVTGNPFYSSEKFEELTGRSLDSVFHEVFPTFETGWSEEEGTVKPVKVIHDFFTAEKLFPGKKKIVHFMQPHDPYLFLDVGSDGLNPGGDGENWTEIRMAQNGLLGRETVRKGYIRNLELIYGFVQILVRDLDGKVLVTSDHGEALGENGLYGHPTGLKSEVLRKVPVEVFE